MATAMTTLHELRGMTVELSPDVLFEELGGEAVLLSTQTGQYYGLNEVGARIWAGLEENTPIAEIVTSLTSEFDASVEQVAGDTMRFLADLSARGIVRVNGHSA